MSKNSKSTQTKEEDRIAELEEQCSRVTKILDQMIKANHFISSPKSAEGTSDFIKNLRGVTNDDSDFDHAGDKESQENYDNHEQTDNSQSNQEEFTTEPHVQVGPSVQEVLLSLLQLPADQRRVLAAKLREVQQDTSIGQGSKAEIASGIIKELRTEARASEDNEPGADPLPPSSTEEPSGVPELKEELTTDLSSDIISTTASEE